MGHETTQWLAGSCGLGKPGCAAQQQVEMLGEMGCPWMGPRGLEGPQGPGAVGRGICGRWATVAVAGTAGTEVAGKEMERGNQVLRGDWRGD